jgi:hypothetical protein
VNTHGDTHEHELGTFGNLAVRFEQIGLFERLETKVVVLKVARVQDGRIELGGVLLGNIVRLFGDQRRRLPRTRVYVSVKDLTKLGKLGFGHLVQVGNRNTSREDRIVGVLRRKGSRRLGRESVEIARTC